MQVTILGCQSPYPGSNGATAGYLFQTNTTNLLVDCGSGVLSRLTRYLPIYKLDALVLSHYHHDHIADVGVLQYGLMTHQKIGDREKDKPLPIYGPVEPLSFAETLTYKQATRFYPIDEETQLRIGDIELTFLKTDHPLLCFAMKLVHDGKTIIYTADTGIHTDWSFFAREADLMICEGTFLEKNKPSEVSGHLTVKQAAEIVEVLKVKALCITHLFPDYSTEEVRQDAAPYTCGTLYPAEVGLVITV